MNKVSIIITLILFTIVSFAQEEGGKTLPSVNLKTITGESFNTSEIENDGNPIIISFWALWCHNCIKELSAIEDLYEDWQDETGVKLYAISIDDARSTAKVGPFVNGKAWEYEVLLDINSDLKRALNINMIPHTFVLDGDRKIVWQHNAYAPGDELNLFEIIKKVKNGEKISSKH